MSKDNVARSEQAQSSLDDLRSEVASLKRMFADMALLVMPPQFRESYCGCGRLSCTVFTAVKGGEVDAKRFHICDECTLPSGWTAVSTVELAPAQRETVAIANRLGVFKRSGK